MDAYGNRNQIYFHGAGIKRNSQEKVPNVKPYVAIKALLTIIIPTEVTTLNIHAAASTAAFLSALLDGAIFSYFLPTIADRFFIPSTP